MKTKEQIQEIVAGIMADFMNNFDEPWQYENTVNDFAFKFNLSEEQEASIRIALSHLEQLALYCTEDFNLSGFVGLECDIITSVIARDWSDINNNILSDVDTSIS